MKSLKKHKIIGGGSKRIDNILKKYPRETKRERLVRILGEAMMILNPSNDKKTKLKKKLEERNNQLVIQPAGPYDHFHKGMLDHHIDHHKAHDLDDHNDKKPTMHIKKDAQESEMYEDLLLKWHPIFLIPNKL